jgi:hypothetical protein
MISQLQQQKRIQLLPSFGYAGVAVKAKRKELLALLRRGLRSNKLGVPAHNGAVEWPEIQCAENRPFVDQLRIYIPRPVEPE